MKNIVINGGDTVKNSFGCDFHIHTKHLRCADETMEIAAIVAECERLGVTSLGIADHLNSLDKLDLHLDIKRDIDALDTSIDVYFGVELNYTGCDEDFVLTPEIKEEYGFGFALGGTHELYVDTYDLKKIIDIQHRHHLKTCRNPLVDVLAHPYWFSQRDFEGDGRGWPWFDTMTAVPQSYVRELGQVARETGTAIEINGGSIFTNPDYGKRFISEYIDYLAALAAEGACFSLGSDAHTIERLAVISAAWQVAEELKLPEDRIWFPQCKPVVAGKGSS